jgi:hypothetical protein
VKELKVMRFPLNRGLMFGAEYFTSAKGFVKRINKHQIDLENADDVRHHAERLIHRMDAHIEKLRAEGAIIPNDHLEMVWTYDIEKDDVLVLMRVGVI